MYISFSKKNPYANGKNGPRSALIHGHITDRVTENHFKTGKRRMSLTRCGPIPGLEDQVRQILAMNSMDFDNDLECLSAAEMLAAKIMWSFKAE